MTNTFRRLQCGTVIYCPGVRGPVTAFDIETTGLGDDDIVTCVCAYDAERSLVFSQCTPTGERCEAFVRLLDEAPMLCAFNGVRFDVPFLARRWGIPRAQSGAWIAKLIDPFEVCRLALGRTFSLDRLLAANGVAGKTGSGLEAIQMAKDGRWDALAEYCMADTRKTHEVVCLGELIVPEVQYGGRPCKPRVFRRSMC